MPTDWSILETDLVRRIKTKLYGNPRYLETIDNSNKKSQETTEYPIAPSVVMKYDDYVESGEEDVQNIENITFNDVISINEADEIMETVKNSSLCVRIQLSCYSIICIHLVFTRNLLMILLI